jgi:hypothetical protein
MQCSKNACRGRDASCLAPPAQIRTCGFPAYGSHLGYRRQRFAACGPAPVTRKPGSESGACFASPHFERSTSCQDGNDLGLRPCVARRCQRSAEMNCAANDAHAFSPDRAQQGRLRAAQASSQNPHRTNSSGCAIVRLPDFSAIREYT